MLSESDAPYSFSTLPVVLTPQSTVSGPTVFVPPRSTGSKSLFSNDARMIHVDISIPEPIVSFLASLSLHEVPPKQNCILCALTV